MQFTLQAALLALGLFVAMLACQEVGRRLGIRRAARDPEGARAGAGVIEAAIFALLGLLIAFTFSGAASRFEQRRTHIVEEANAIGTAWLRIDLLPAAAQGEMRDRFRRYLDARLAAYRAVPDMDRANAELARATGLQQEIWSKALAGSAGSQPATMLLLPALNQMFDIATTRTAATRTHPPTVIFVLLCGLALLSGVLAGDATAATKRRDWIHTAAFAVALAGAVYVILDLEFPRLGLIRVDGFDDLLVDLRKSMN